MMKKQSKEEFIKDAHTRYVKRDADWYNNHGRHVYTENGKLVKDDWLNTMIESEWETYNDWIEETLEWIATPLFDPDKIVLTPKKIESDEKTQILFCINGLNGKYACLVRGYYDLDTGYDFERGVELVMNLFIPVDVVTYENRYGVLRNDVYVTAYSLSQLEQYIAITLDVDNVNIQIEEPVTPVTVHKMTGFPMYFFSIDGVKYVVTLEKHVDEDHDYLIKISTNKEDMMLDTTGIKKGRLFKTVLLKRLNDWFKDKFNRRAQFKWGKNFEITK